MCLFLHLVLIFVLPAFSEAISHMFLIFFFNLSPKANNFVACWCIEDITK